MARKPELIPGDKYGMLTCIGKDPSRKRRYFFKCECGNVKSILGYEVKKGNTVSCGCRRKWLLQGNVHRTHGDCYTRLYGTWQNMRRRCETPSATFYRDYGGRGITICDEWLDYQAFKEWALNNGYRDDLTIDRIDVNGNYEPSNCRWVTQKVQANNTRRNHRITYNGETHTLSEWSEITGIGRKLIAWRIEHWGSVERAFLTPVAKKGARKGNEL